MSESSAPPPDPNKIASIANTFRKQREEKKIIIIKEEPQLTPTPPPSPEREFIPISKPDQDERVIPIRNTSVNLSPQAVNSIRSSLYASAPIINNTSVSREIPQQKNKNISQTFSTLMKVSAAVFIAGFIFGFIAVPLFNKNENNNDNEEEEELPLVVKNKK
jgi:hypothetical protein